MQKLEGPDSIGSINPHSDPELILSELVNRRDDHEDEEISHCLPVNQEGLPELEKNGASDHETTAGNSETTLNSTSLGEIHSSHDNNYQTTLHDAVHQGQHELVKILLEGGADVHKLDSQYEDRTTREHRINLFEPKTVTRRRRRTVDNHRDNHFESRGKKELNISQSSCQRFLPDYEPNRKRVTIHMQVQNGGSSERPSSKLIMLPNSIQELLIVAGKIYYVQNTT